MTVEFTPEEVRAIGARTWLAWARENPAQAQAHLRGVTVEAWNAAEKAKLAAKSPRRRQKTKRSVPNDRKRREAHMRRIRHER